MKKDCGRLNSPAANMVVIDGVMIDQ